MKSLLEQLEVYGISIPPGDADEGNYACFWMRRSKKWCAWQKKDTGCRLILAIGPRATTDTSASVHTPEGQRMGYRLRGQEQIVRAVEDVKRAAGLGCRGFMVYDEGCLWLLNEMRKRGELPADSHFKVSAHTGHGNPCVGKAAGEHRRGFL